jgi:hypothetical protein
MKVKAKENKTNYQKMKEKVKMMEKGKVKAMTTLIIERC